MEEISKLPIRRLGKWIHVVDIDSLPDELLESVFNYLPPGGIASAKDVCKRWHRVIYSGPILLTNIVPQKPWYFMWTSSEPYKGHVFDSALDKWYHFRIPDIISWKTTIASSCGLLSFLHRDKIYVFNPITPGLKALPKLPFKASRDCDCRIALSTDRSSCEYMVSIIQCTVMGEHMIVSIHLYESATQLWSTLYTEVLAGWVNILDSGVICNGILYCLIEPDDEDEQIEFEDDCPRLVIYDLFGESSEESLLFTSLKTPPFIEGYLLSLSGRLLLVGGTGLDESDIITAIQIWELQNESWYEVAIVPSELFKGLGKHLDGFACSAANDLIFIQSLGSTDLLVFDVVCKQWRWCEKCPVTKRMVRDLRGKDRPFEGFCFEPRFDISP